MAQVDIEIAGRRYTVACRDGEEPQLRSVAAIVDGKAHEAAEALGSLSEARQLLYAALLLADELKEHRSGQPPAPRAEMDPALAEALDRLARSAESLAQRLEAEAPAP